MNFWSWMLVGAAGAVAGCGALFYILRLASNRSDALRRAGDHKTADTTDQLRFQGASRAALPMHDRAFDRPR